MEVLYVKYVNMYVIMEIVIFLSEWEEIENLTILPTHVLIQHKILKNNDAYLVDILLVSEACRRKKMGLLSHNDAVSNNLILRSCKWVELILSILILKKIIQPP